MYECFCDEWECVEEWGAEFVVGRWGDEGGGLGLE